MNDSPYGLTASIWTTDLDRAAEIGDRVATGTVFANRCDYLDPGAHLDRREGHRPRRRTVEVRLRRADAPEELSSAADVTSTSSAGTQPSNWNSTHDHPSRQLELSHRHPLRGGTDRGTAGWPASSPAFPAAACHRCRPCEAGHHAERARPPARGAGSRPAYSRTCGPIRSKPTSPAASRCSRRASMTGSSPSAAAAGSIRGSSSPSWPGRLARSGISRISATGGRAPMRTRSRRSWRCRRRPAPARRSAAPAWSPTRRHTRRGSSSIPEMMPKVAICDPELTDRHATRHHSGHGHGCARPLPGSLLRRILPSDRDGRGGGRRAACLRESPEGGEERQRHRWRAPI